MVEYKYDLEKYEYNPNRDAIKKWLLNLPSKYFNVLDSICGVWSWHEKDYTGEVVLAEKFMLYMDEGFYDEQEQLWLACFKDLSIDYEDKDIYTFQYLLYALVAWLNDPKNLKLFKVNMKKNDLKKDFTNA